MIYALFIRRSQDSASPGSRTGAGLDRLDGGSTGAGLCRPAQLAFRCAFCPLEKPWSRPAQSVKKSPDDRQRPPEHQPTRRQPLGDFIKYRALMLPEAARYDALLKLPKGASLDAALVEAMNAYAGVPDGRFRPSQSPR
jgi:hypothetical protein